MLPPVPPLPAVLIRGAVTAGAAAARSAVPPHHPLRWSAGHETTPVQPGLVVAVVRRVTAVSMIMVFHGSTAL
jgi:hypothetical protein